MAVEVAKIEIKSVMDASGLSELIEQGRFKADEVVAVVGKTEGNGGVNDFTRILSDQAYRAVLMNGTRVEALVKAVPMVWSGGCDGVITPHATIFAETPKRGAKGKARLSIGTAMSVDILPEDIGRPAMVEKVAEAVRLAMKDAGIKDRGRAGCRKARQDVRLRGSFLDGRFQRHDRTRHRSGAGRGRHARGA
jgi:ring-opening amidohydrolase-like protein